jgi:hypothetical protein
MRFLLLAVLVAVLAFPAAAAAGVTPYYSDVSACVSVDTSGVSGNGPISVNLYSPDGNLYDSFKTFSRPQVYTVCVSQSAYQAEGGFGWFASAKIGGTSLGSTEF